MAGDPRHDLLDPVQERAALAGGLIIGAAGFGNAAGPLIGGFLTDALSWRWILFLNLPIAALACLVTWRVVPESRGDDAERRFDYAGVATLSLGLIALLVALDEVDDYGWALSVDPWPLVALSSCLLAAFVLNERRVGQLGAHSARRHVQPPFAAACVAVLLMSPTFFVSLVYLPQFMQKSLGYSPVEAGLGLLPMMGVFALVSFAAGPLYERLGPRPVLAAGSACLVAGPALISVFETGDSWAQLVPGMVVLGAGVGLFYSAITTAAVTALDPSRSSLAGGIVYMFQVAGGSVGLGIATTVFTARAGDGLSSNVERVMRDSFESGFQATFLLVAALALAGFVVTVLFVGRRTKAGVSRVFLAAVGERRLLAAGARSCQTRLVRGGGSAFQCSREVRLDRLRRCLSARRRGDERDLGPGGPQRPRPAARGWPRLVEPDDLGLALGRRRGGSALPRVGSCWPGK